VASILVLGPVEVWHVGRALVFARQQERYILGVLALEVGRPVATDRLVDLLWGDNPPRSARAVLQTRVSELRTELTSLLGEPATGFGALGSAAEIAVTIESRRAAYALMAPEQIVDAYAFLRKTRDWRSAGTPSAGRDLLRSALDLWRGPVLGEAAEHTGAMPLRQVLESARLTALEDLFELELSLGNHAVVADEILRLSTEDQTRERLMELAMIAQYRSGRATDALRTFDRWRRWLDDEFGAMPGQRIAEVHRAILRNVDPEVRPQTQAAVTLAGGARVGDGSRPTSAKVPRTLPPDVATFAGRDDELALLMGWLSGDERVVSITGAPGVGKTALSLRAAYQLADRFVDGQLFADLRGADGRGPVQPEDVLRRFLRALGVDVAAGASLDEHIDVYRTVLADRKVLVICDNVSDDAQVEPLIPPGPGNRMIINGRSRLHSGLATRTIELAVFDQYRAIDLLRLLLGDERVDAEPAAASELVRLCGQLPLALRIVAARLRARPHWTIDRLVDSLRGGHPPLDQLTHGHLDVRLSIGLSYHDLKPDAKLLLCAVADLDLTHLSGWAAAALLDCNISQANTVLDELFDAHLADVSGHDAAGPLYQIHDLIRAYALEQSLAESMADRLREGRLRLYGIYLHIADHVQKRVSYGGYLGRLDTVPRWIPDVDVATLLADRPAAWFETERAHFVTLIRRADADGDFDVCSLLARLTYVLFEMRRSFDDGLTIAAIGRSAADRAGDRQAAGALGLLLAMAVSEHGRHVNGLSESVAAQEQFRRAGDVNGVVGAAVNLALMARFLRTPRTPYEWLEPVIADMDQLTDRGVYAFGMRAIGQAYVEVGRLLDADTAYSKSLATYRTIDAPIGECQALVYQGRLFLQLGDIEHASAQFGEALAIVRELGDVSGIAQCLRGLAAADRARGDLAGARARLSEALELVRQPKPTLAEEWVISDLKQLDLLDSTT
jgi:DNA-binding SARP family transcriptional activator